MDTDIWIFKNFESQLKQLIDKTKEHTDILMQDGENYKDFPIAVNYTTKKKELVQDRPCERLCTGFMVLKPTKTIINLFDYKENKKVNFKEFVGNQPYLNQVIQQEKIPAMAIDRSLLPNGSLFLNEMDTLEIVESFQSKAWLIHYTYLLGEEKIQKMQEHNHWNTTPNPQPFHIPQERTALDLQVRCTDGFANQLRLALAGTFLVQANCIKSYTQEWVLNNHNNVNYTDFFYPLPKIKFEEVDALSAIRNTCFQNLIEKYSDGRYSWEDALSIATRYILPKAELLPIIENYLKVHDIPNALGIHARRTCKTALLELTPGRSKPLSNEEMLPICHLYEKTYVATDNQETQAWFKSKLEDKMISYDNIETGKELQTEIYDPEKVERHTSPLHTVMDFISLRHCKSLLGSSESSLSLLLYHWRNNPNDFHLFGKL
jgi:hypothetical protein